jgi:Uma2 family endonuclease
MTPVKPSPSLVSLAEYLATSYDPDVEYVDGVLVERNVGDWLHSLIQRNLIVALSRKYPHLFAVPELRSRTRETRYRLPDVSVLLHVPETRFLLEAAHIAIEILSEDDRMSQVLEKLAEYEAAGIAHIWLVEPRLELLSVYSGGSLNRVERLTAPEGIELTPEDVFTGK